MNIFGISTLLLTISISAATVEEQWNSFKAEYNKSYLTIGEEQQGKARFTEALKAVNENNNNSSTGVKLKINKMAVLTDAEFFKYKVGFIAKKSKAINSSKAIKSSKAQLIGKKSTKSLPASVDWRTLGAVTPVKDQKNCGSCWAFSSIGALEGQMFIKYNKSGSLSAQQMVDCGGSMEPYLRGCNGGVLEEAFDYVRRNKGIDTEESYPYTALGNGSCHYNSSNIGATCKGYVRVKNEQAMMEAVANIGPIAVSIGVNKKSTLYSSGIFPKNMCYWINNHGVLIVGYGENAAKQKYWIVKNSWGTSWGMNGYFHLPRGKNACGVKRDPLYPIV